MLTKIAIAFAVLGFALIVLINGIYLLAVDLFFNNDNDGGSK